MKHPTVHKGRLCSALIATGLFTAVTLGAMASSASAAPVTALTRISPKAAPIVPLTTPNTPQLSSKPRSLIVPLSFWSAGLGASSNSLWPQQYSTLTATANHDVGPTPYYLSIYDTTASSYVKICGFGTTCVASVTQPNATTHNYVSVISSYPTAYPPANKQATSANVAVNWRSIAVSLSTNPTTLGVGGTTTLSATTSADVGPTPFYTEIFDTTTGARIGVCGFGTVCNATTSQSSATTHRFVAYVSNLSTVLPPPGTQATSAPSFVTWTWSSFRVSLSAPGISFGNATATATVNQNVGPTPYWIEIFNENGTRLAVCGSGTTCSATFSPAFGGTHLIAFVSSYSTTFLPSNVQATSNVTNTSRLIIFRPLVSATTLAR